MESYPSRADPANPAPAAPEACSFLCVPGCSGLGYLFWYAALARLETSRVVSFLYLEPLVTLVAAVVWLGESVGPPTVAGGIVVLFGVYLVQQSALRRRRSTIE